GRGILRAVRRGPSGQAPCAADDSRRPPGAESPGSAASSGAPPGRRGAVPDEFAGVPARAGRPQLAIAPDPHRLVAAAGQSDLAAPTLDAGMIRVLAPRIGRVRHHAPRRLRIPTCYQAVTGLPAPPVVTLVTPARNAASFLERTLLSVASQAYPALEYVIQDAGSTDGTLE